MRFTQAGRWVGRHPDPGTLTAFRVGLDLRALIAGPAVAVSVA